MSPDGKLHRGLRPENSEVTNSSLSWRRLFPLSQQIHVGHVLSAGTLKSESTLPSNLAEHLTWQGNGSR